MPRKVPFRLRALRTLFRSLGRTWPDAGASMAYRLWFRVYRVPEPAREVPWREAAESFEFSAQGHRLAAYRWGERDKPLVLLMHGWGGRGVQLGAFVEPLIAAGYRVASFDAPGHGRSTGDRTSLPEVAATLAALAEIEGQPQAVVAHSFGSMAVQHAMRAHELQPCCVVSIGAPTSVTYLVEEFTRGLAINKAIEERFAKRFERDFGADLWARFDVSNLVPEHPLPALIIHDRNDNDVSFGQGEVLHRHWPESKALWTDKLGHWRILRNPELIDQAVHFIEKHRVSEAA